MIQSFNHKPSTVHQLIIITITIIFVAQEPPFGPRQPHFRGSYMTHNLTHTLPVGRFWKADQIVENTATYATHDTYNRQKSMPSVGFETAVPTYNSRQKYVLNRTANRIGIIIIIIIIVIIITSSRSSSSSSSSSISSAVMNLRVP
jgi:hypothetical protein